MTDDTTPPEALEKDRAAREAAARVADYEHGWSADIEQEFAPKGLSEDTVRFISAKKNEPEWMLQWRLKAYRHWLTMTPPDWAKLSVPPIDYQDAYYYAAPKKKEALKSLDEVDPDILKVYEKLGIPLEEQKVLAGVEGARKVAVDAVFDSVSVATTFREELKKAGVIFLSISEAIREHPDLVKKWLGRVVPQHDNYFAALNCAVFSDGTFVYIPEGVRCPMELSTYFRINAENTGQFERTLIVADKGSYVSYLEGCTAPQRDENQLHAAVVELVALDDAEIKYSTVQNWYPGDAQGKGGIYNFVTKRGLCQGKRSKISWTQVETGSAITWKYPSCVLNGEDSVGEFYSVAVTNNYQQADTGTKMIHNGAGSRSTIISKGISAGKSNNTYRGLVRVGANAEGVRNFTQCDSLLLGKECGAHTVPYIEVRNPSAQIEHEATTSKISDDQLFYAMQRGLDTEEAVALIVNGFAKEVLQQLPMEFAVEAQKLLGISLEGERRVSDRKKLALRDTSDEAEAPALKKKGRGWEISEKRLDALHDRAREMRRHSSPAHKALAERFAKADLGRYTFKRHAVIGSAIVDFNCHNLGLAIAIDEGEADTIATRRDKSLEAVGIRVLRLKAGDILEDMDAVLQRITAEMRLRIADKQEARRKHFADHPRAARHDRSNRTDNAPDR